MDDLKHPLDEGLDPSDVYVILQSPEKQV